MCWVISDIFIQSPNPNVNEISLLEKFHFLHYLLFFLRYASSVYFQIIELSLQRGDFCFQCSSPPQASRRVHSWASASSLSRLQSLALASHLIAFSAASRDQQHSTFYFLSSDSWEFDTWGLVEFHLSRAVFICSSLPDTSSRMLVHHL